MRLIFTVACIGICALSAVAQPQPFSSSSTGADGALIYAPNLGVVYFPPVGLAPRTGNVYNFTSITIGDGTTVRLSGWVFTSPVWWLVQGDCTVNGTIDLSGQAGHAPNNAASRAPSEPGAGGYSGGLGRFGAGQNATAGNGPGGGQVPGSVLQNPEIAGGGTYSGSAFLQPLVGGSGGAGGCKTLSSCGGGGAGGGALVIASSTTITLNGNITALGGNGTSNYGGGGSGGAIRLVSNTIRNTGTANFIDVRGGSGGIGGSSAGESGGAGLVRFEAFSIVNVTASFVRPSGDYVTSIPYNLAPPVNGTSTVSVTSVNNTTIGANPFTFPDTTITTGAAVPVVISGANIPPGTTGALLVYSETSPDQSIPFTLVGSIASTSATVNVAYPAGGSRGFAKVIWMSQ